jgi:predicted nuclease of restriction endonuclease-like RecB superfamily
VLTVEHVRYVRRAGEVKRTPLQGLSVEEAEGLIGELAALAAEYHGRTRGELVAALSDVVVDSRVQRGLRPATKLILDACDFSLRDDVDPVALRQRLFAAAAAARAAGAFDRDAVVAAVAIDAGLVRARGDDDDAQNDDDGAVVADITAFDAALYADLDEARLVDASALRALSPQVLRARWELAELQAFVLKATRLTIDVEANPRALRALLGAMKLQQLLFEVTPHDAGRAGVRLVVEGPATMFSQSTRYGMKLAMLVPKVLACRRHRLEAELLLKKGAATGRFVVAGASADTDADDAVAASASDVDDVVTGIVAGLGEHLTGVLAGATVAVADEVLIVKGVGACVPDVMVSAADGRRFGVELLGFWSRDAVWRRVALAERGLDPPVVFCVSERLRVSEAALDDDAAGALLVYKGVLSLKKLAARLLEVAESTDSAGRHGAEEHRTKRGLKPM